jgi:homopolymeric O-antigen transport system permease protein
MIRRIFKKDQSTRRLYNKSERTSSDNATRASINGPYLKVHIRIRPTNGWAVLSPRTLWSCRELLYFLTWRDLKVRYAQTALGALWAVLQPLSMMLLFTLLFSRLSGLANTETPYPLFAYAGLLPWTFFSNAISHGGHSLVGSAHIITKVYFPRVLIPIAAVLSGLVDLLLGLAVLVPLMLFYQAAPTWQLLGLPVAIGFITVAASAIGIWIAAVNVKYRDVRFALPFIVQLWLFASPVFYSTDRLPEKWRWVMAVNPVAAPIEVFRASLLGLPMNHRFLWISGGATIVLLAISAVTFRRIERSFADIV